MTNTQISPLRRLLQAVGGSAEYAVALALLVVCGIVGAVFWLGGEPPPQPPAAAAPAAAAAQPASEAERAAVEDLQRELREQISAVEQREREEAERAEQARLEAERRERELAEAREAARRAEEEARRREAEARAAQRARRQAEQQRLAKAAAAREPVRTAAAIRWDSCRQPEYPRASRIAGEEGVVVLSLEIDASGRVSDGQVKESSGSRRLDITTLRALKRCAFEPATVDGEPVATTGDITFAWALE